MIVSQYLAFVEMNRAWPAIALGTQLVLVCRMDENERREMELACAAEFLQEEKPYAE